MKCRGFFVLNSQLQFGNRCSSFYLVEVCKYSDALKISKDDPSLDPLSNPYFPIYTIPKNYNGDLSKEITEYRTKLEQEHEKNIAEGIKDMVAKQNASTKANALTKTQGISIGMTASEVENSYWGKPTKVNKTTTANSVSEQWVYSSGKYVYLENGIVNAIQE